MRFLVVESDGCLRFRLLRSLAGKGCLVDMVFNMEDAFILFERFTYSVVIIGTGFSGDCTAALIRAVRGKVSTRSILMRPVSSCVTADSTIYGADDYLCARLSDNQLSDHWIAMLQGNSTD